LDKLQTIKGEEIFKIAAALLNFFLEEPKALLRVLNKGEGKMFKRSLTEND